MVFVSHAIAVALLISLAVAGKIDGFWWLAWVGVALCLAADAVVWVRTLATSGQMREQMQQATGGGAAGTSLAEMLGSCLEHMGRADKQFEAERQRTAESLMQAVPIYSKNCKRRRLKMPHWLTNLSVGNLCCTRHTRFAPSFLPRQKILRHPRF